MKKLFLTASLALALGLGASAQTVVPLLPSAHGLTTNQPAYIATQEQTQEINLAAGWSWWSSYVDLSDNGLGMLQTALGANATTIKSQTQVTNYASGIWAGTLTAIDNTQMYAINTANAIADVEMTALPVEISDVQISGASGWTWVGFPSNTAIEINAAMANYTPVNGSSIKSQSGVSTYNGTEWFGTLTQLEPGMGYKLNGPAQSFYYAPASKSDVIREVPATNWTANVHNYATNMNIFAVINLMGEEVTSDNYEVAAFAGDCRGAVVPMFEETSGRHIAFMTISGNDGDNLEFRLLDKETGDIYVAENNYTYMTDAMEGSLKQPYVLYFNRILSNQDIFANMKLFPNPVNHDAQLTISMPVVNGKMRVEVINALGVTVMTENVTSEQTTLTLNVAPGIYTVKMLSSDKQLSIEKLIVK